MSEKKEKQYAVLKYNLIGRLLSIVWFDARKDARTYAKDPRRHLADYNYRVMSMTRGPGA